MVGRDGRTGRGRYGISGAYHMVFLGMSIASFLFAIGMGLWGAYEIFKKPDKYASGIIIEAVSVLGFFYSRWTQKVFLTLFNEASFDDKTRYFASSHHTTNDPQIFREIMKKGLQRPGGGLKGSEIDEY